MKKPILSLLLVGLSSTMLMAQNGAKLKLSTGAPAPFNKVYRTGLENGPAPNDGMSSARSSSASNSSNGVVLGTTTYDLQTNSSTQNRLVRFPDGTMSAVWTLSNTFDLAASDRGTGYVYFDGTSWSAAPTSRIETQRGGWPSILGVNGGEFNSHHNTSAGAITYNSRPNKGTGTWNEANLPTLDMTWNRSAVGGSNGNTIHVIAVTTPTANGGTMYQGQDGALVYYRSTDGGSTWDIQGSVLPGLGSNFFNGFSGDGYSIAARGNTVAIAVFNEWADLVLMKSTDNGTTWTKTIVNDFPLDFWEADDGSDYDNNGSNDTLYTTDGAGDITIDVLGKVHMFYGLMRVLDADLTDGSSSYFPYTNGLMYWNEDMPTGASTDSSMTGFVIAQAEDFDGDGVAINGSETDIAQYFTSLAGTPSVYFDDLTQTMYVSYTSYMENLSDGSQAYRHIYLTKSTDFGMTWSLPFDATNKGIGFEECVFSSIVKGNSSDSIRFIYQEDNSPGLAVRGDEDPFGSNEIVYVSTAPDSISNTPEACITYLTSTNDQFCVGDTVTVNASAPAGATFAWSTGATTSSIEVTSYNTYTVTIATACGAIVEEVNFTAPSAGPNFDVEATYTSLCAGDSSVLSTTPVSLATYLWSNGATTPTTTVSSQGTYYVTVTNCGGSSVDSIEIVQPTTPVANLTGPSTICSGDTATLSVQTVTGGSYLWSNGATTPTIDVTATGSYSVTVTNCAGTANASITVSNPSAPSAAVSESGATTFCEGEATLTLTATGGSSWMWSNGATTNSVTLSTVADAGTYTVTVYNDCGDDAVSTPVTVTINPAASTPTVTYNNDGTYSASSASSYQWYLDGSAVSGATGQTFDATWYQGSDISVEITDANGCTAESAGTSVSTDDVTASLGTIGVYPNPSNGTFNVQFENAVNGEYSLSLVNMLGQVIDTRTLSIDNMHTEEYQINDLDAGVYMLNISNGNVDTVKRITIK